MTHWEQAKTPSASYAQPQDIGPSEDDPATALESAHSFFDVYSEKREVRHLEQHPRRLVRRVGGLTLENIEDMLENDRVSHLELIGPGDGTVLIGDDGEPIDWAALRSTSLKQGETTLFTFAHYMPNGQSERPLIPPTSFCSLRPAAVRVTTGPLEPGLFGQDDEVAVAEALVLKGFVTIPNPSSSADTR